MTRSRVHAHSPIISCAEFYEHPLSCPISPCLSSFCSIHPFHVVIPTCISRMVTTFHPAASLRRKLNSPMTSAWNLASPRRRRCSSSNITWAAVTSVHRHCPHRKDGRFIGRSDRSITRSFNSNYPRARRFAVPFFSPSRARKRASRGRAVQTSLSSRCDFYINPRYSTIKLWNDK